MLFLEGARKDLNITVGFGALIYHSFARILLEDSYTLPYEAFFFRIVFLDIK